MFCLLPCVLVAFMMHSKACFEDIKSLFVQMDRLCKCGESHQISGLSGRDSLELEILKRCKEAVHLHQKVNR